MTDRRRNLFVLLLVAAPAGGVAGGHRDEADAPGPRPQGRRLAHLPGQADQAVGRSPATPSTARWTSCASASTRSASPSRASSARAPTRSTSRCPTSRTPTRRPRRSAPPPRCGSTTGRAASSGPTASPIRRTRTVTGGQAGGRREHPARAVALRRRHAGREVPAHQHGQGVLGRQVLPGRQGGQEGPGRSRRDRGRPAEGGAEQEDPVRRQAGRQGPAGHGHPVRAEQPDPKGKPPPAWYVLNDQPILGGTDIKNPEQSFDNGPGESGQPNVTFDFTGQGANVWQKFTRKLAQRGQEFALGASGRRQLQPALRDHAGQRADLGPADRLAPVPRRPGRRQRLADLGRLHDRLAPSSWPTC